MAELRLDKLLSETGYTRSEAKLMVKNGRVKINGVTAQKPEQRVSYDDEILVDGLKIGGKFIYVMLNKPEGVLTATEDEKQKTVLDILGADYKKREVFPVGRLDKDTTGLLILTNDGELGHKLTSPRHHVSKVYEVTAEGALDENDVAAFSAGIELRDGTKCLPAKLCIDKAAPEHASVEITEGKYHQVKRMFAARGKPVLKLKRVSIGALKLDEKLAEGEFRMLEGSEVKLLFTEK